MAKQKQTINVLSIDGGGIRGVIPAQILIKVEEKLQSITRSNIRLSDHFDLIVGTSTGAILTGIYSIPNEYSNAKYSADYALKLYQEHGNKIFKKKTWRRIKTVFGLFGAKYDDKNMIKYLSEYFGDIKIGELSTNVMITAVDINNRNLFLFKSYNRNKQHFSLVDAVRSSTSAPTYFTPYKMEHEGKEICLIDGGMAINNPSISAYIEAKKIFPGAKDINLLSVGTGKHEKKFTHNKVKNWGILQWIAPLINIILGSNSEAVEYQTDLLYQTDCSGEFLRINPPLKRGSSEIDNATDDNIENLRKDGEEIAESMASEIEYFLRRSLGQ